MAEATTVKEPDTWALLLNNKQRAGKRPQLPADQSRCSTQFPLFPPR